MAETTLYDAYGNAVAYIASDLTIYLWSGQPVAYLEDSSGDGHSIYGFNGKHLGWFVQGVLRDHQGHAAGGTPKAVGSVKFRPFKSFKQFKPFKEFKEFAPFRPFFIAGWSPMDCEEFLLRGAK